MKKIQFLLVICMCLTFTCVGCSQNSSDEIAVLTYRLEQAEAAVASLEERISALEAERAIQESAQIVDNSDASSDNLNKNTGITRDSESLLLEMLIEYKNSPAYIKYAYEDSPMELQFAAEYLVSNLEGHKVNVILASVNADRDVYGIDVGHVMIDLEDGKLYHSKNLDIENFRWENISSYEDALTAVFACYTSWMSFDTRDPYICTEIEFRKEFTQEQIERIQEQLN